MRSRDDTIRATRPKAGPDCAIVPLAIAATAPGGAGWEFVHVAIDDADADRLAGWD
jgi:hypothetical protein